MVSREDEARPAWWLSSVCAPNGSIAAVEPRRADSFRPSGCSGDAGTDILSLAAGDGDGDEVEDENAADHLL
jgi:hypothetical protein